MSQKRYFCNFLYSNRKAKERIHFFNLLSKYKKIHSGGKVLNNLGYTVSDKPDFIKDFIFTIAFENSSYPGYTTEKIIEPMRVHSIPIYWGNPIIGLEFNEKSFINCHNFSNFKEVVEYIIYLDNNKNALLDILAEPWFKGNVLNEYYDEMRLVQFFEKIFTSNIQRSLISRETKQILAHCNVIRKRIKSAVLSTSYCHTN